MRVGAAVPAPPPAEGAALDDDSRSGALARLEALVGSDLSRCNALIVARMDSPVALIPQLAAQIGRAHV